MGSHPATPHDHFWERLLPETFVHPALDDDRYVAPWHGTPLAGTAIFTLAVSMLIMCGKVYSRLIVMKKLARDDWVIILALVAFASETGVILWAVKHSALGKHIYDSDEDQLVAWFKAQYIILILSPGSICLIRMSVLLFIRHLDSAGGRGSQLRIKTIQVINALWFPASVLPQILLCVPHNMKVWDVRVVLEERCITHRLVVLVQRISMTVVLIGAILDFMLLFLPVRLVWNLQHISTKQKAIISSLFALGLLACIGALMKAVYIAIQIRDGPTFFDSPWAGVTILICAQVEAFLGILAACAPSLKPLFTCIGPGRKNSYKSARPALPGFGGGISLERYPPLRQQSREAFYDQEPASADKMPINSVINSSTLAVVIDSSVAR